MPRNSPAARVVAHRLLAGAGVPLGPGSDRPNAADPADSADPADPAADAERACRHLAAELSRWFGPFGVQALFTRALADARAGHPALAAVGVRGAGEPWLDGLPDAARAHGARAATEGVVTILAALIDLLGRLIGEDMAVNLVSQAMLVAASGVEPDAGPNAGPGGPGARGPADAGAVP